VISEENRGAEWIYIVRVLIGEMEYGRGIGSSKKRAEQAASKETLELIGLM
jgi:dsRNA-specific ribonuclease